jgi:hypothetical protein
MAIWQFTFYLVPRQSVEALHGADVIALEIYQPFDLSTIDDESSEPNYWAGHATRGHAEEIAKLLPPRRSWSEDALMFGEDSGDEIDVWNNEIRVRLDLRNFNEHLAIGITNLASAAALLLVCGGTGRVLAPEYSKLAREIANSRARKFVEDPRGTLEQIARNDDEG